MEVEGIIQRPFDALSKRGEFSIQKSGLRWNAVLTRSESVIAISANI
jgi:hypothetical protein